MAIKYEKGTFIVVPNKEAFRGKPAEILALFNWLCGYADEKGKCFPSRAKLARDMQSTPKTVDKYLKMLEELGVLSKETRKGESGNLTNIYQIMVIEGVGNEVTWCKNNTRGSVKSTLGSVNRDTRGSVNKHPTLGKNGAYRTISNLTNSNLTESITIADTPELSPGQEENMVLELFSVLNKNYASFFAPGPQRTSVKKLIKFAKADGRDIAELIQMAKDIREVEYAPQIFSPLDMVEKYDKLLAFYEKKLPNIKKEAGVPYTKGKYADDKTKIIK